MNKDDTKLIEHFIKEHQKKEAHEIKEFNKLDDWIAVEMDDGKMSAWVDLQKIHRRRSVEQKKIIQEFALLLGKNAPTNQIRTSGMLVLQPTVVV